MNQPGKSLGVIGLGGLGHMGVKFGSLNVTIFSTSISKKEETLSQLGTDNFVVSSDRNQMKALVKSVDFIIDIASGDHPFDPYVELLKLVEFWSYGMKTFSGSVTGGTKDIQEMIDFFASNGIHPMIEKFQFNLQMKLLRGY
ncbi:unnamed protein product [Prunus armeniaca]